MLVVIAWFGRSVDARYIEYGFVGGPYGQAVPVVVLPALIPAGSIDPVDIPAAAATDTDVAVLKQFTPV